MNIILRTSNGRTSQVQFGRLLLTDFLQLATQVKLSNTPGNRWVQQVNFVPTGPSLVSVDNLGNRWVKQVNFVAGGVALSADIEAGEMMKDWQEEHKERRDELVELLGIDLKWRMHQVRN